MEAAAAAAVAAAVAAARADLGPLSEEGTDSEVDPSPSEVGFSCKDLKENECVQVVQSSAGEVR